MKTEELSGKQFWQIFYSKKGDYEEMFMKKCTDFMNTHL